MFSNGLFLFLLFFTPFFVWNMFPTRHLLSNCNGVEIHNPNFKPIESDRFKEKLRDNAFMLHL